LVDVNPILILIFFKSTYNFGMNIHSWNFVFLFVIYLRVFWKVHTIYVCVRCKIFYCKLQSLANIISIFASIYNLSIFKLGVINISLFFFYNEEGLKPREKNANMISQKLISSSKKSRNSYFISFVSKEKERRISRHRSNRRWMKVWKNSFFYITLNPNQTF
jgi:hypothetical protein